MTDEPDWHRPSPRLLTMRRLEVALLTVALAVAVFVVLAFTRILAAVVGAGVVLLLGAALFAFVTRRVGAWGYVEREDDLFVRRGVMFSRLSVIPYGRMQFIDVTAGPDRAAVRPRDRAHAHRGCCERRADSRARRRRCCACSRQAGRAREARAAGL